MYSNKIKCMVVLAISFFSGVICNSLNLTNPCTCTKYCIKNDTENLWVSENSPLIISFNGLEFEKKMITQIKVIRVDCFRNYNK